MADVIAFPVQQLELPLWWANPEKWENHSDDETVSRPTEIAAIRRILRQSKALHNTRYRTVLTALEKQVVDLEILCLRRNQHFSAEQRYAWIAQQVRGLLPFQVVRILDEITQIQHAWMCMEESEKQQLAQYRKTKRANKEYRQLVFEAMKEAA